MTNPATVANQTPAALIMLRWPRPATATPGQDANSLLNACQQHLADDGIIIVVVTTAATADTRYGEHEQTLLPAARAAGLRHLHDIIPLDAQEDRDAFTYATDDLTADKFLSGDHEPCPGGDTRTDVYDRHGVRGT